MSLLPCLSFGDGLVSTDSNVSNVNTENSTNCTETFQSLVTDSLTAASLFVANQQIIPNPISPITPAQPGYYYLGMNSLFDLLNPAKYVTITNTFTTILSDATVYLGMVPFRIQSLRTFMINVDNSGDVGNVSFQLADPSTGNPFPGIDIPAFIGTNTFVQGIEAVHILNPPLAPETPFIIRAFQSGLTGTTNMRIWYHVQETSDS